MSFKKHTVRSYDQDLKSISTTLDEMMSLVIKSIDMIGDILKEKSIDLSAKIIEHDKKINSLDNLIEKKVTSILALRQPMAIDLRYIISSIKVSSNLERIGDQSKSIIKKISKVGEGEFRKDVKDSLIEMIEISKNMVKNAVFAFNSQNIDIAQDVMLQDDKIDNIYWNISKIAEEDNFTKEQVKKVITTLLIAKSFERLADHSENIAEISKFVVTGEIK